MDIVQNSLAIKTIIGAVYKQKSKKHLCSN